MAGKKTTTAGEEPTGKAIRLPSDGTVKVYNSAYTDAMEGMDDIKETLKDATDVAKKKHLNPWAFRLVKGLFDKFCDGDPKKGETLAMRLAQFDKLRAYFKLDEFANLQGRLMPEGEMGSPPREKDEDGEPDMRPDHLCQPGASAAEPSSATDAVRELAAKAGATPRADDDALKNVGRGKGKEPPTDTKH